MSVSSRTNRWTSRLVIVLQLVTWSAVSIVLLQKGVNSLHRKISEADQATEADLSIGASSIESGTVSSTRKNLENKTRQSVDEIAKGKPDDQILASNSPWKRKHEAQFSRRVSASGAAIAVAMIVIGTIMLLLTPAVVVLRLLDKRRRARKSQNELPDDATWQDLPPTYEQVVLMNEEAPRYSTLVLSNQVDDDVHLSPFPSTLSPSPSPSPSPSSSPLPLSISSLTFSPTYGSSLDLSTIKSYSHR